MPKDTQPEVNEKIKPIFSSEYEFFLNFLWSQKGYQIEDNGDEYYNLENLQSTEH